MTPLASDSEAVPAVRLTAETTASPTTAKTGKAEPILRRERWAGAPVSSTAPKITLPAPAAAAAVEAKRDSQARVLGEEPAVATVGAEEAAEVVQIHPSIFQAQAEPAEPPAIALAAAATVKTAAPREMAELLVARATTEASAWPWAAVWPVAAQRPVRAAMLKTVPIHPAAVAVVVGIMELLTSLKFSWAPECRRSTHSGS